MRKTEVTNAMRVAAMGVRDEEAAVLVELLDRISALEKLADEKDGRPSEAGHTKAKKT